MHPDHDPLDTARAALDAAAPDTAALMAARLLAEALRRAAGLGEARALLDALEAPLRACEAAVEAILATASPSPAERPAVAPGDEVVFHAPGPCGRAGPQRQGVVVETGPAGVAVALSARARIWLPHGSIVRNLTRAPAARAGDAA